MINKIVLISDTHGLHSQLDPLPEGNILVHAGDLTNVGKLHELKSVGDWLQKQLDNFEHVICIAGNHDFACEHFMRANEEQMMRDNYFGKVYYLRDTGVKLNGLYFYGSPWQPEFNDWAFNLSRGFALRQKWDDIPVGVDVLVTHGPPLGVCDYLAPHHLGCGDLRVAVDRVQPRVHVFGHIHGGRGTVNANNGLTQCFNASVVDERYRVVHKPWVVELKSNA